MARALWEPLEERVGASFAMGRLGEPEDIAAAALFLLSDALLALERFADVHLPAHEGIVMATYTSGQALLARL